MRCEGWRRKGGALSFGPPTWTQCTEDATVMIQFKQGKEDVATLPGCPTCWQECIDSKDIEVLLVFPIGEES